LSSRVLAPLGNIAQTMMRAQQAFEAVRGLSQLMGIESERTSEIASGLTIERGDIVFENVDFSYPEATLPALRNLSFSIKSGEAVGFAGRIGSGKTTIGKILAGLHTADDGKILIDGIDIQQYDPAELRRAIGFLSQEPELFAGTLRENILLGKPTASEEEIAEALHLSGVDTFANTHPLMLRKPKILFLDEPSSAMDGGFENALVAKLREYIAGGRTLIVCAHRGAMTELIDRLVILEKGSVVGDGPKSTVVRALREQQVKASQSQANQARTHEAQPQRARAGQHHVPQPAADRNLAPEPGPGEG